MEDNQEDLKEQLEDEEEEDISESEKLPFPPPPFRSTRLHIQRSNVCSRAYFVVVMVFFHVYILNVIALLLYVHYNNGPEDLIPSEAASSSAINDGGSPLPRSAPSSTELHLDDYSQSFSLPRIEGIRVGHVQRISLASDKTLVMKTLSLKPLIFEIPGFLSEEECRVVVQLAQLKGLMETQTPALVQGHDESNLPLLSLSTEEVFGLLDLNQDGLLQKQEIVSHSRSRDGTWLSAESLRQILINLEARPTGTVTLEDFKRIYAESQSTTQRTGKLTNQYKQRNKNTWLYQGPGSHHVLQTLKKRVIGLTRLPSSLVELSEPLQVVRYEHGDYSDAHYDSSPTNPETSCAHTRLASNTSTLTEVSCRYLTVQFYLSSVEEGGETTFPVADNRTYDEDGLVQDGIDLTDTQQTCHRGNLRIRPTVGMALLWYNHLSDGKGWMGDMDEYSLRGDCPVKRGLKWVASSWINVDPDHLQQARYQRLVAQRHQVKSGLEDYYQPLSHNNLHQDL
ncbi:transmembrane prolyl 4-hydroxylase-like [Boleophthalmus pectinirostris]|uniref:transmembrane prolyl 4-hydroxylase-like n=1 Tax=Boleophthalmus pectinirostris TaxID=150288 RepID=UPI000A1C6D99|nr:transmembrane prolyl 4-hydroxylase-like [Boleophthalmus pectinirostris]